MAACSGNPLNNGDDGDGDGDGDGGGSDVPDSVAGRLVSATYEPGADTILVNIRSQDDPSVEAVYTRDARYDVEDYFGYTSQETTSNRITVALVKQVGNTKAAVALNGQFAEYYAGGTFSREGLFNLPTSGVGNSANYSGTYTGLLNAGPTVSGPGGDLDPIQPRQTTGRALITADFAKMELSGGIDQRRVTGTDGDAGALPTALLRTTDISTDGRFEGIVTVRDDEDGSLQDAGDYAGLFGGANAREIAALLVFNPIPTNQALFEHGLLVLPSCATGGGPACPVASP
ncbi:hypothetical protein GEU84_007055 [Fertoebacter nigrum]|uniref:Thymidylate synthase n=1 Tax=Fertoeibacter niger TaxID=2656921 RepID=A0A8X8KKC9_9RHOB|nr:hypothetical protein [Fertoeibacter niger]NUB44134.1 hypothetical protein [Fertoeibacter niger]